jgi:hypothetical protein
MPSSGKGRSSPVRAAFFPAAPPGLRREIDGYARAFLTAATRSA